MTMPANAGGNIYFKQPALESLNSAGAPDSRSGVVLLASLASRPIRSRALQQRRFFAFDQGEADSIMASTPVKPKLINCMINRFLVLLVVALVGCASQQPQLSVAKFDA